MSEHGDMERDARAGHAILLEKQSVMRSDANDRMHFMMELAQSALKSLSIANGGAIVSLFTVLDHQASGAGHMAIWAAFALFAFGLSATLASYLAAFLSQLSYFQVSSSHAWNSTLMLNGEGAAYEIDPAKGHRNFSIAILSAMIGVASFISGAAFALWAVL